MFINLFFFIINPFKICHSLFLYTLKGKTFVEEKSFNGENLSTGKTFRRRKYLSLDQMLTKCSPMKVVFLIKFSFLHFFLIFWFLLVGLVWCKRGGSIWKCFRRFFSKEYQLFYRGEFETISECFRCFKKRQSQNKRVSKYVCFFCILHFCCGYDFQQSVGCFLGFHGQKSAITNSRLMCEFTLSLWLIFSQGNSLLIELVTPSTHYADFTTVPLFLGLLGKMYLNIENFKTLTQKVSMRNFITKVKFTLSLFVKKLSF